MEKAAAIRAEHIRLIDYATLMSGIILVGHTIRLKKVKYALKVS